MALKVAGMTFDRQTVLLAGGAVVAAYALSSLFRGRSPVAVGAAPAYDVDALMTRLLEATESGARAASGGVGAGASIAIEGIASGARIADRGLDLAGDVTSVLGRIAERESVVLGDVTERVIAALERTATAPAPRVAPPPAAAAAPSFTASASPQAPSAPPRAADREPTFPGPTFAQPAGLPSAPAGFKVVVDGPLSAAQLAFVNANTPERQAEAQRMALQHGRSVIRYDAAPAAAAAPTSGGVTGSVITDDQRNAAVYAWTRAGSPAPFVLSQWLGR